MKSIEEVAKDAHRAAWEDKSQLMYHPRRIEYRMNMIKQLLK